MKRIETNITIEPETKYNPIPDLSNKELLNMYKKTIKGLYSDKPDIYIKSYTYSKELEKEILWRMGEPE